ncbi:MAG: hypothetical protein HYW63_02435 [Candidatus Levybacteria bacterium]|nr:hypothetical protein [Candidatus Levybacteria bacterium]
MVEAVQTLPPGVAEFSRSPSRRPLAEIPRPYLVHFSIPEDARAVLVDNLFILGYRLEDDEILGIKDELSIHKPRGLYVVFPNGKDQYYTPPSFDEAFGRDINRMLVTAREGRRQFYVGEDYEVDIISPGFSPSPPRLMEVILGSTSPVVSRDIDPNRDQSSYLRSLRERVNAA